MINMKIVMIWHSGSFKIYRVFPEEIAKQKDVECTLIVPEYWPKNLGNVPLRKYLTGKFEKNYLEEDAKETKLKIVKLNAFLAGKTVHFYPKIWKILNEINPDVIYVYEEPWSFCPMHIIMWKKKFSPQTKVVIQSCENLDRKFNHFYENFVFKYNIKNCDAMAPMSPEVEQVLRKKGYAGNTVIIGEGSEPSIFKKIDSSKLRKQLGIDKHFVIGFVGRFHESKGLLVLIEAVSKLKKDFRLMLVGDGELKEEMINLAKKLNVLDKIIFTGRIKGEELPKYINCFDLGVSPSLTRPYWKEQFGRFTGEFLLCEVPIIGSSSSTVDFILGKDAIMYKEDDPNELAQKIKLLMCNKKLRDNLVKVGKKKVLEGFTNEKLAEKFVNFAKGL